LNERKKPFRYKSDGRENKKGFRPYFKNAGNFVACLFNGRKRGIRAYQRQQANNQVGENDG